MRSFLLVMLKIPRLFVKYFFIGILLGLSFYGFGIWIGKYPYNDFSHAAGFTLVFAVITSIAGTALTSRDSIKKKIDNGEEVNSIARLMLASGVLSFVVWLSLAVTATFYLGIFL